MLLRPRGANASVLPRPLAIRLISAGLVMAVAVLLVVSYGENNDQLSVALTMGLVSLSLCHLIAAITTRDPQHTALSPRTLANRRFTYLSLLVVVLTILVTELNFLQRVFETVSLTGPQWGICLLAAGVTLAIFEIGKFILNRAGWLNVSTGAPVADEVIDTELAAKPIAA